MPIREWLTNYQGLGIDLQQAIPFIAATGKKRSVDYNDIIKTLLIASIGYGISMYTVQQTIKTEIAYVKVGIARNVADINLLQAELKDHLLWELSEARKEHK